MRATHTPMPVAGTGALPATIADVRTWGSFAHPAAVAARDLVARHVVAHTYAPAGGVCDVCGRTRDADAHGRDARTDDARYLRVGQARRLREYVAAHTVVVALPRG